MSDVSRRPLLEPLAELVVMLPARSFGIARRHRTFVGPEEEDRQRRG